MSSHAMDGALLSQITSAAMVVYLLQFLKKTSWYPRFAAWLPIQDAHVHRLVSAAGAFIAAVGIHIAFTGSASTGWQFAGTIPPVTVLLHSAWDWAQQFALNQLAYDAVAQKAGGGVKGIDVSQSFTSVSSLPGSLPRSSAGVGVVLLAAVLGAGVLVSSCGTNKLVAAANAEQVAVTAVHAVVQAEAQAYRGGAYDAAHHQMYVAALLKVTDAEKTLNDALTSWNAASGQPMPAQVTIAVQGLTTILADVTPLIPQNSAAAQLAASATAAIQALAGGK